MSARRLPRDRELAWVAAGVFLLAFVVRLVWVVRVQSPWGAVYSDMEGYVQRAVQLLEGRVSLDPRYDAFYPWGTHVLVAAELAVFGKGSLWGIGIVQSLVGALVAPASALLGARLFATRRTARLAAAVIGVVVALWHPHIAYSAFFMSEVWFSAGIAVSSWLLVRHAEGRGGGIWGGLALAIAYAVRPQVILTLALVTGLALLLRPRGLRRRRPAAWAGVLVPFFLVVAFSAARLHHLSGRLGLMSENDALNRVFGDTSVGLLDATWTTPNGATANAWYSPTAKQPLKEEDIVRYQGYIGDPVILDRIRKDRLVGVPFGALLRRRVANVRFLVWKTWPNPEGDFRKDPRRAWLMHAFRETVTLLLPLAAIGAIGIFRRARLAGFVVVAHLGTIMITAAFFFAEARHRVPYDVFLVIAATAGVGVVASVLRAGVRHWRGRAAA